MAALVEGSRVEMETLVTRLLEWSREGREDDGLNLTDGSRDGVTGVMG